MRYSLEPTYRRYVKGYGFLSFATKFGDKYCKKLINTAAKVRTSKYGKQIIDTKKNKEVSLLKLLVKNIVQRSAEATGDLIGNKIADKITSLRKSKNKEKEKETNEEEEMIIPPEKRQQVINDLRLF